jgi:hypothetical protein
VKMWVGPLPLIAANQQPVICRGNSTSILTCISPVYLNSSTKCAIAQMVEVLTALEVHGPPHVPIKNKKRLSELR